jgi:hypothetical protein
VAVDERQSDNSSAGLDRHESDGGGKDTEVDGCAIFESMSSNNGSNPRLDRIERMIEGLAKSHAESDVRFERRMAESDARFERRMAESGEEFDRKMAKSREEFDRKLAASTARAERDSRRFRDELRRWAALGVKEARKQRKHHGEIEMYLTRLAAAQLVTEEKLKDLMSSRGSGRNGGGRKSV